MLVTQLCPSLCDPMERATLLHPWDTPGKNTVVSCHSLLQGIFPNWGSNPGFPYCRQILYHLSHQGSPGYSARCQIYLNTTEIKEVQTTRSPNQPHLKLLKNRFFCFVPMTCCSVCFLRNLLFNTQNSGVTHFFIYFSYAHYFSCRCSQSSRILWTCCSSWHFPFDILGFSMINFFVHSTGNKVHLTYL